MCGRYTQTAAFDELALRFGITIEDTALEDMGPRYNVAPSQPVPIVVGHTGGRRLVMATWGFHPAWLRSNTLAPINAKAETIGSSRLFEAAVRHYRCLVPADGFYEWKPVPGQKRKQPHYFRLTDGRLFAFAGLYTPPDARAHAPATCTIITTTPNELVAPIHDRMPVILAPDDESCWADASVSDPAKVLPCLRPLSATLMEAYPVSTLVSSSANDGPRLVEPVSV